MFDQLLEVLLGTDPNKVYVTGWWLTPDDRVLNAHGKNDHYKVVLRNLKSFNIPPDDPICKSINDSSIVSAAISKGGIRLCSTPSYFCIDSQKVDKETLDRVWSAFPQIESKDIIWDSRVKFRGNYHWVGKLKDLETLIESKTQK